MRCRDACSVRSLASASVLMSWLRGGRVIRAVRLGAIRQHIGPDPLGHSGRGRHETPVRWPVVREPAGRGISTGMRPPVRSRCTTGRNAVVRRFFKGWLPAHHQR
jgi:hypothetical protein